MIKHILENELKKALGDTFLDIDVNLATIAQAGHYGDYWRFFDDTIIALCKDFSKVEYVKRGGYFKALFFFLPMQHKLRFIIDPLASFLDGLFQTEKRTTTSGYYVYAIK